MPGIFAVGEVRPGSAKRIGSALGEDSIAVVRQIMPLPIDKIMILIPTETAKPMLAST
jgi:hypothetical protein